MIFFPAEMEHPEPDDYAWQPVNVTAQTPVGEGYFRTRNRAQPGAQVPPSTLHVSWLMPPEQEELLFNLYSIVLNNGADQMVMPVWFAGAFHAKKVLFKSPPSFKHVPFNKTRASADFVVQDRMSNALWARFSAQKGNFNTTLTLNTFTSTFTILRPDVFVSQAGNSSTSDKVTVGWSDDLDAIVDECDAQSEGHFPIRSIAAGEGGTALGVTQTGGSLPRTLVARWIASGIADPTEGEFVAVIPYRNS